MKLCDHCIQQYELDCDYLHLHPSEDGMCKGFLLDYANLSASQKNAILYILSGRKGKEKLFNERMAYEQNL